MDLIAQARTGDGTAFARLTDPYRRELHVHCYRMLGSVHDADDAVQDSLLAAWQALGGFEGRSSIRTWLYRVATNHCLNALRSRRRRPPMAWPSTDVVPPDPTRLGEVSWLEPYPDAELDAPGSGDTGPEGRYEAREAMSLAFVTALQLLPPRQRAVVVLRDALGLPARDVAVILGSSEESVTSALKRARATLRRRLPTTADRDPAPPPQSAIERGLLARLVVAYDTGDVAALVALLTDDVWITMPPVPLEYHGRELAALFHASVTFRGGRTYRVVETRANGQPAFAGYARDQRGGVLHASGLVVLTVAGDRICAMTRFDNGVVDRFGLPRTLPG